jgi:hypothetical protein
VTQQWVQGHLFDIMTEVGTMSRATGLEQKDLCILIDLVDYKDPPIVIKKVKDVLKGREMPKWNGTENNSEFRAAIKERYESMDSGSLLFLHRSHDTDFGVCTMRIALP